MVLMTPLMIIGCRDFDSMVKQFPSAAQAYKDERKRISEENKTNYIFNGEFHLLCTEGLTNNYNFNFKKN